MRKTLLAATALIGLSVLPAVGQDEADADADAAFADIMDRHWAWMLETNPVWATSLGEDTYSEQLADPSLAAYDAEIEALRGFRSELDAIDVAALSDEAALNHALLTLTIGNDIEGAAYGGKYMTVDYSSGPHQSLTGMPDNLGFFDAADFESYVARLGKMDDYMAASVERLREGVAQGWTQPCAAMEGYEASIETHLVDDVSDSVFMDPFETKPAAMSQARFDALREEAAGIVETEVIPAIADFNDFYADEYAPACRDSVGASTLPDGDAYYAYRARVMTTTDTSPDEIHELGLSEVARIRAEMDEVIAEAGFDGTFEEWLEFLRTDPQFYPQTPEERMTEAARIAKKMDGELPRLFGTLPRMPYGLKEIPPDIAEKTTTAYYMPPAGDGTRAGFYFVNTTLLDTRPLYELEALSLHEAVPGHHLQIALAQELDLPEFRKHTYFTAFVEGWGLYAERLGEEAGFYETPYTKFGQLSYEMWRACRLVVDTGMHSKGWTRQEAIDYMAENSALSMNNITREVDRYITWPGQALAYKMGELKIRELREFAEAELGEDFDIRAFHDTVLENGAVPLSVLDRIVRDWVAAEKA